MAPDQANRPQPNPHHRKAAPYSAVAARKPKKSRRWSFFVGWSLLGIGAALCAGAYALLRDPSWYRPPVIAQEERQRVRNSLIDAEQAFTENLMLNKPFEYHIYEEDVNRWIAMRREIYPLIDELMPPELLDPLVIFDQDTITIAGRRRGTFGLILSLDIDARFEDNRLTFRPVSTRCGSVKVPVDLRRLGLDGTVECPPGDLWPGSPAVQGTLADGVQVESVAWWKNGGMEYRITDFVARPGELLLKVQPLGRRRHVSIDESDQP